MYCKNYSELEQQFGAWAERHIFGFRTSICVPVHLSCQHAWTKKVFVKYFRFHVMSGCRLGGLPVEKFDSHINTSHQLDCIKDLLLLQVPAPVLYPVSSGTLFFWSGWSVSFSVPDPLHQDPRNRTTVVRIRKGKKFRNVIFKNLFYFGGPEASFVS